MNWGCICFDLDNTLLNYEKAFKSGMLHTFRQFFDTDYQLNECDWFTIFKHLCDELWNEVELGRWTKQQYKENRLIFSLEYFDFKIDRALANEFQSYFYSIVHQFVEPFAGVYSLLEELKHRKQPIGLITNGDASTQHRKMEKIDLNKWFCKSAIFISGECGAAKPNPKIFEMAHWQLGNSSLPSLYIGDSWELDIVGAINAGWDTVYFNSRNKRATTTHKPIAECYSFSEVKDFVIH